MVSSNHKKITRNVEATVIPSGDRATIPQGIEVTITHRLGGNFTITCDWGMFRIAGKDADALDESIPESVVKLQHLSDNPDGPPNESVVWEQLKSVYDPEIPVNIVDLGLIYSMEVIENAPKYKVLVNMTLTAPGCGMGPAIAADAKNKLLEIPGINDAEVEIVWDPPWTQDMISTEGKMQLGLI